MFGPSPSGHRRIFSVQAQYSSRVSFFQANTGMPAAAMAAAAWSWVEKMLQDAHRTWAPRATRVSMRTAVWIVAELGQQGHQAGHLLLGEVDLLAAEVGQREVGDLEVADGQVVDRGSGHSQLLRVGRRPPSGSEVLGTKRGWGLLAPLWTALQRRPGY
jgi:hypothetical protein